VSELATLTIKVDSSGAIRAVDQFGNSVGKAAKESDNLTSKVKKMVLGFATFGTAAMVLRAFVRETVDAQREQALLANILRTTGEAAGRSLTQLNDHADALRRVTAFGGGDIADAQRRLLSYTEVVGAEFDRATLAVLNFSQEFGVGTVQAAEAVGKALNYPTVGLGMLSKQGFIFTESQKQQIKYFEETNQLAKAQGIILGELESVINGSAAAYRNTLGGALAAAGEAFLDLFEVSSPGMKDLVEDINDVADALTTLPTRIEIVVEKMRNVRLQFEAFFDLNGGKVSPIQEALARLEGRSPLPGTAAQLEESNIALVALQKLLEEQTRAIEEGRKARAAGRAGGTLGSPIPDAPAFSVTAVADYDTALKGVLDAFYRDAAEAFAFRMDAMQQERESSARILPLLEGYNSEAITLDRIVVGMSKSVEEMSESVRVFREQTQIALGRFFADFLKSGISSVGTFWEQFKQLGRDALGNIFAREVMSRIGDEVGRKLAASVTNALGGTNAGLAGGVYAGIFSTILSAIDNGNRRAQAIEQAARSIAEFAARPALQQMDATQRAMLDLIAERDALARNAARAAGFRNTSGSLDDIRTAAQNQINALKALEQLPGYKLSVAQKGIINTLTELVKTLGTLDKAYAANVDAAKSAAIAAENQVKAERWAAKQRQSESLQQFRDSLNLSAQSPLSPTAQLAEARRQYELILALAQSGDRSAIASLPETARTLLDASRAVNASGVRYAEDFAAVQADTLAIIEALRTETGEDALDVIDTILERTEPWFLEQISIAKTTSGILARTEPWFAEQVSIANDTRGILERTQPWLQEQVAIARDVLAVQQEGFQSVVKGLVGVKAELTTMQDATASLTVQQAGFQAVVDELVNVKEELSVMKNALKLSLDDMAAAL